MWQVIYSFRWFAVTLVLIGFRVRMWSLPSNAIQRGGQGTQRRATSFEIPCPRYTWGILLRALAIGAVGATLTVFVFADPHTKRRAVVALVFAATLVCAVHVPYLLQALWCLFRRARNYPHLVRTATELEDLVARHRGRQALGLRAPQFTEVRFYTQGKDLMFALDLDTSEFSKGDALLIIQTLERKQVGVATVVDVTDGRLDAGVGDADPVFEGFVRQQLAQNQHRIQDIAVVSQRDVDARDQAIAELLAEDMA